MSDYNGHKPRPFQSREDTIAHLRDKRYRGNIFERDTAYISFVEECLKLSEDDVVGANVDFQKAMGNGSRPEFQDPLGDLDKDTSVYHSVEEQQADARNPKYKTDPYFREQVARKIARSTPDWEPQHRKQYASLQVVVEDESGEGGTSADPQGGE